MLKNENIICISSIDWDFIWQGHQEIMSAFAENGNRVLFIENTGIRMPRIGDIPRLKKRVINWLKSAKGFREERKNLFVYSPLVLPFPYSRIARFINKTILLRPLKRWLKVMGFRDPIMWTFLPTGTAMDIIDNIDRKLLVYYCIADFYKLVDDPRKVMRTEDGLIKKCDVIFAQGGLLKKRCLRLNNNVEIFQFGVNMKVFKEYKNDRSAVPDDIANIKGPVVGYVGGLHKHIDLGLIAFIADSRPDWSIVLVGPAQMDVSVVSGRKNVFLLGKKEFGELPAYIDKFNVCIIPYEINDYTKTVFPTKLNEYHATGKPVVSTALPEVIDFNKENDDLVHVGSCKEDFLAKLEAAVAGKDEAAERQRIESAKKNSWSERIEEMSSSIESALDRKSGAPMNWQETFLQLYRVARVRMIKFLAAVTAVYLLVFYTPVIWYAARPLVISQQPLKSDCIVVFGGGVGESGRAGQGYEERVERAVELYKNGYADKIIFSSGFTYLFKEPLIMKALAVSLGVPEGSIILEERAKNTIENVEFTRDILKSKGWSRILLISSPYHMGRASLVFRKIAGDINVTYVPISKSRFYDRSAGESSIFEKKIGIVQIGGIVHEYLGIIYYWFKGYV